MRSSAVRTRKGSDRLLLGCALGVLGALGGGCVGISQSQSARTLGQGKMQHTLGAHYQAQLRTAGSPQTDRGLRAEHTFRRGMTDSLDGSLRLGFTARCDGDECPSFRFGNADVEAGLKWGLTRQDRPLAVSFAPALGVGVLRWPAYFGYEGGNQLTTSFSVRAPLLIGYLFPNDHELVLSPQIGVMMLAPTASVTLAYLFRVSDVLVIPELGAGILSNGFVHGQIGVAVAMGDLAHPR